MWLSVGAAAAASGFVGEGVKRKRNELNEIGKRRRVRSDGGVYPFRKNASQFAFQSDVHFLNKVIVRDDETFAVVNECRSSDSDCNEAMGFKCIAIDDEMVQRLHRSSATVRKFSEIELRSSTVVVNGHSLQRGKSYCLHKNAIRALFGDSNEFDCNPFTGVLEMGYDLTTNSYVRSCKCKWPEFFGGGDCSVYIGCAISRRPDDYFFSGEPDGEYEDFAYAPLINRVTMKQISDPESVAEDDDLYASLTVGVGDTQPLWYCGCKSVNASYTGGLVAGVCRPDPCFPLNIAVTSDLSTAVAATGMSDARNTTSSDGWSCECGDPFTTHLFGGGEIPCQYLHRPLDYESFDVIASPGGTTTIGNVKCSDRHKVFIPCRNLYRRDTGDGSELISCRLMGYPSMVNYEECPDAGQCVDICTYGSAIFSANNGTVGLSICEDDTRTVGLCRNLQEASNANVSTLPTTFTCECSVNTDASWWETTQDPDSNKCRGSMPPCKTFLRTCDYDVHYSRTLGPMCCHGLACIMGLCIR